jgi:hypothetical protein
VLDFAGEHENFTNKVNFLVHGTIFGLSVNVLFLFVVRCNEVKTTDVAGKNDKNYILI